MWRNEWTDDWPEGPSDPDYVLIRVDGIRGHFLRGYTGESGEIHVRGEQVSGEYLGRASNIGSDGWFPTRDGGSMDAEGYLFIEGRIDDGPYRTLPAQSDVLVLADDLDEACETGGQGPRRGHRTVQVGAGSV